MSVWREWVIERDSLVREQGYFSTVGVCEQGVCIGKEVSRSIDIMKGVFRKHREKRTAL